MFLDTGDPSFLSTDDTLVYLAIRHLRGNPVDMPDLPEPQPPFSSVQTDLFYNLLQAVKAGGGGGGGPVAASDVSVTNAGFDNQQELNDSLTYVGLNITSFTHSAGARLKGSTLNSIDFAWTVNKTLASQSINNGVGAIAPATLRAKTATGLAISAQTVFTLTASDGTTTKTANVTVYFSNDHFYGVGLFGSGSHEAFMEAFLTSILQNKVETRAEVLNVNAGAGQKIYYGIPTRLGACTFNVGGFAGGFNKIAVFDRTNAAGFTESYDLYESTTAGLGVTQVTVS